MFDSLLFKGPVRWFDCYQILELYVLSGQAVLAIAQLHHLVDGVTHSPIVLDHYRLHGLDQTTLDVTWKRRKDIFMAT